MFEEILISLMASTHRKEDIKKPRNERRAMSTIFIFFFLCFSIKFCSIVCIVNVLCTTLLYFLSANALKCVKSVLKRGFENLLRAQRLNSMTRFLHFFHIIFFLERCALCTLFNDVKVYKLDHMMIEKVVNNSFLYQCEVMIIYFYFCKDYNHFDNRKFFSTPSCTNFTTIH